MVERTVAWRNRMRRLTVLQAPCGHPQAFLTRGCCLIGVDALQNPC